MSNARPGVKIKTFGLWIQVLYITYQKVSSQDHPCHPTKEYRVLLPNGSGRKAQKDPWLKGQ